MRRTEPTCSRQAASHARPNRAATGVITHRSHAGVILSCVARIARGVRGQTRPGGREIGSMGATRRLHDVGFAGDVLESRACRQGLFLEVRKKNGVRTRQACALRTESGRTRGVPVQGPTLVRQDVVTSGCGSREKPFGRPRRGASKARPAAPAAPEGASPRRTEPSASVSSSPASPGRGSHPCRPSTRGNGPRAWPGS